MTDARCRSDAAYVLGSLPPAERREYETHLAGCADCQASVRDLAGLPGLLGLVTTADLDDPPPVPESLLPDLVGVIRRRHRLRRRLGISALGMAAAIVVAVVALQAGAATTHEHPQAMHPVLASPVHATVALVDKSWGTRVDLRCSYDPGTVWKTPQSYRLVVTDRTGGSRQVASWLVVPDRISTITGSLDWHLDEISNVTLQRSDGTTVLSLRR